MLWKGSKWQYYNLMSYKRVNLINNYDFVISSLNKATNKSLGRLDGKQISFL